MMPLAKSVNRQDEERTLTDKLMLLIEIIYFSRVWGFSLGRV